MNTRMAIGSQTANTNREHGGSPARKPLESRSWTRKAFPALSAALSIGLGMNFASASFDGNPSTLRVSTSSTGAQSNDASYGASLSETGRYVAFSSEASNLVSSDVNDLADVFVKDMTTNAVVRISVGVGGTDTDGESTSPSISGDGQRVAFVSEASNLVASDGNHLSDVFVHDLAAHAITRASMSAVGLEADGPSSSPRISADGRYVAFASRAANLVDGDTNGLPDVFVRDLESGVMERVSVGVDGAQADGASEGPAISADGRFVAFSSTASNLLGGGAGTGRGTWNVYVRDRVGGSTVLVSVSLVGGKGDGHSFAPAISADGRYVAFASAARDLVVSDLNNHVDVFLRDLVAGSSLRVSRGPGGQETTNDSTLPVMSADGQFIAFQSQAENIVEQPAPNGVEWVCVHNRVSGSTSRVTAASWVCGAAGGTNSAAISPDGRWIAFASSEDTLVAGDSNEREDVFVRGPQF